MFGTDNIGDNGTGTGKIPGPGCDSILPVMVIFLAGLVGISVGAVAVSHPNPGNTGVTQTVIEHPELVERVIDQ